MSPTTPGEGRGSNTPPAHDAPAVPPGTLSAPPRKTWSHAAGRLFVAAVHYVWHFHLRSNLATWRFARRVWKLGWPLRLVIAGLLLLAVAAKASFTLRGPTAIEAPLPEIFFALCALTFGVTAAAFSRWGAVGFVLIVPWLAYFAFTPATVLAEHGWLKLLLLPLGILLAIGWRLCVSEERRARAIVLWLVFAFGAGMLTSGVSGFRAALAVEWWVGGPLLGTIFAAAGGIAWWQLRERLRQPPRFGAVLLASGASMAVVLLVAAWSDTPLAVSWVANYFPQLDTLVTLFWFWSGGGFTLALWRLVTWFTRRGVRTGFARPVVVAAPFLWAAFALLEWILLEHEVPSSVTLPSKVAALIPSLIYIAPAHIALTAVVLALLLWWRWRRRPIAGKILELNTLWMVCLFAMMALASKMMGFHTVTTGDAGVDLALGAAMVGVLGILVGIEKDWSAVPERRVALYATWGAVFMALLLADRLDPTWELENSRMVQVFEGMLTLGLPLAILEWLARRTGSAMPKGILPHLAWFMVGTLVAVAIMNVDPVNPAWLLTALPVWLALLLVARALRPSWSPIAGAMAGTMLAAGTTLYWRLPAVFCFPFSRAIPGEATINAWYAARKSLDVDLSLAIMLLGLLAGGVLGAIAFAPKLIRTGSRTGSPR